MLTTADVDAFALVASTAAVIRFRLCPCKLIEHPVAVHVAAERGALDEIVALPVLAAPTYGGKLTRIVVDVPFPEAGGFRYAKYWGAVNFSRSAIAKVMVPDVFGVDVETFPESAVVASAALFAFTSRIDVRL